MDKTTTAMGIERPYKPSWIDRFKNSVKRLSIRVWTFYIFFGFLLIIVQMLFLWIEGGLQDAKLIPVITFNGLFTPFLLGLLHLLDNQALTSLDSMRPMLEMTESEFDNYQYMLSNMPSREPLIAGLTALVSVILLEQLWVTPVRYAELEQLPIFAIVFHTIDKSSAFLFGAIIYHTIRQLH